MIEKPKILFIFEIANTFNYRDGLWAALNILDEDYDILRWNLAENKELPFDLKHFDFILGWSSLDGEIAHLMRNLKQPHGICVGGYEFEPSHIDHFNVIFAETNWYIDAELKPRHKNVIHAFGINVDIFKPIETPKIFDYLTIGSFSTWKRQILLLEKQGNRIAVGYIQEGNMDEAFDIISQLLAYGVLIQGEVAPEILCQYINASKVVYIPATINGGGERSVLEARACRIPVEIADDNPKLKELLTSPIWDQYYYASQLKKGIESCLKNR